MQHRYYFRPGSNQRQGRPKPAIRAAVIAALRHSPDRSFDLICVIIGHQHNAGVGWAWRTEEKPCPQFSFLSFVQ